MYIFQSVSQSVYIYISVSQSGSIDIYISVSQSVSQSVYIYIYQSVSQSIYMYIFCGANCPQSSQPDHPRSSVCCIVAGCKQSFSMMWCQVGCKPLHIPLLGGGMYTCCDLLFTKGPGWHSVYVLTDCCRHLTVPPCKDNTFYSHHTSRWNVSWTCHMVKVASTQLLCPHHAFATEVVNGVQGTPCFNLVQTKSGMEMAHHLQSSTK